jgi:undecaprenyl-diphosphatase
VTAHQRSPQAAGSTHERPSRTLAGRLLLGGLVALVVAIPFTLLLVLVTSEWEPLERLDRDVADDLHQEVLGNDTIEDVLEFSSTATSPWVFRVVVIAVAVWLWSRGLRRLAGWALTALAIGGVAGVVLKLLVERARPNFPEPVYLASGYSFPSGHALNSFLGVGILLLIFFPVLRGWTKATALALGAAVVLFTGYDRIALGVHYVSDVVAGWAAALAVIAGTAGGFEVWRLEHGLRMAGPTEGLEPESADAMRE